MKRLFSNKRGEVSFGQKRQNTESSSDSENDDDDLHSQSVTTAHVDNDGVTIPKEKKRVEVTVKDGELMYLAAFQGDWVAAEVLLERDPNLAFDYVTEEGDRALHVAASMNKKEFVEKLVGRMSEEQLLLLDGDGNSACCYAAISGYEEIARLIIGDRPNLVTARDGENVTPLRKAVLPGNWIMVSFLLGYAKDEDLSTDEWFDLLLVAIRCKMLGVAIGIIEKNVSIARMANEEEGTALHLLARLDALPKLTTLTIAFRSLNPSPPGEKYYRSDFDALAKKLLDEMLEMEKAGLMELMKKPVHILHEAAKTGQVMIIQRIIHEFPKLIQETDSNGYTIFHMAVMYRQRAVFDELVHLVRPMLGSRITSQDRRGNNILHLAAAKSTAVTQVKVTPAYQLQNGLALFEDVERLVPPTCMRNGQGLTPQELFTKTHKKLLKESKVSMTNRADSLMLIATILLTVVFAAAFTVPGSYSSQTGEPLLAKKNWFKAFVVFEVLSIMFSIFSIIIFQSIMGSSFAQDEFLFTLPTLQTLGFQSLLISLMGAFLAFMASISLFNLNMSGLVWFGIVAVSVYGVYFLFISEMGI